MVARRFAYNVDPIHYKFQSRLTLLYRAKTTEREREREKEIGANDCHFNNYRFNAYVEPPDVESS